MEDGKKTAPIAANRVQLTSLGGVGIVAGVCTQTPELASLRLAFRGLYSDPGHDLGGRACVWRSGV